MSAHQSWSAGGSHASPGGIVRRLATGGEVDASPSPRVAPQHQQFFDDDQFAEFQASRAFETMVDTIVDRVEQRVVDELERRGRRQGWAAF